MRVWESVRGSASLPSWLNSPGSGLPHPMAFQIVLESLEEYLQPTSRSEIDPVSTGRRALLNTIRTEIYREASLSKPVGSLRYVVDALRDDQRREHRRIARVISFNADDLLERFANVGHDHHVKPVVWPVSRASYHPRRDECANGRSPIPIYHVHGYLPRHDNAVREAPDTLVFTDLQYWDSVASPTSFANRVVGSALHESHCVFIGMSMHDINLMRWLGNYASEVQRDKLSEFTLRGKAPRKARRAANRALRRHYWVRTKTCDVHGLMKSHLLRRGVFSVPVSDWGNGFGDLLEACFQS